MPTLIQDLKPIDYYSKLSTKYLELKNKDSKEYLTAWTQPDIEKPSYIEEPRIQNPIKNKILLWDSDVIKLFQPSLINSSGNYLFLPEFKKIFDEIILSKEILTFKEGWDGIDADPIPEKIYNIGITFLIDYSTFIYNNIGTIIDAPEINPGRNKNLFLSWRTKNARLAISIEKDNNGEIVANYYGDLKNNKHPIKGNVSIGEISEFLAYWMKNLI